MRGMFRGLSAALLVVLIAAPAVAQTTNGALIGDVTDSSGARLPGVTVRALSQQTGATRETVTNELGSYRFNALMPADYTVTAELNGFKTLQRKDVTVSISNTTTINFVMEVAGVAESVTVTEQAPLVETTEHA